VNEPGGSRAQKTPVYAKCSTCDLELADREKVNAHCRETMEPTGEPGVTHRGHTVQIVNPTQEEQRAARARQAIADALDKACEELWDEVERGRLTLGEIKAEMWAYDFDDAWGRYVEEAEE
jgi:hypothetical protein